MNDIVMKEAIDNYQTPFYVFDTDIACAQVRKLKMAFGSNVDICYAMKANPFIISALQQTVDYYEVCSMGELRICEHAHIPVEKIVMSGVYKNQDDIYAVLDRYGERITYTVESLSQWKMLDYYARQHNLPIRVLLRLTSGNQFGLDEPEIFRIVGGSYRNGPIQIEGIQFFSGTQKKSVKRIREELRKLDAFLSELGKEYHFIAKKLEYGPGFPVNYFEGESDTENEFIQILTEQLNMPHFKGRVVLEMGRRFAAACGSYFTKVVDMKRNRGNRYCIIDGGIHQLNYYGQMMGMKKPPLMHWDKEGGSKIPWTVCGALCTMNDVLAKDILFSGLHIGSVLIFGKVGAYSATEGMALFLSRDLPQILLYSESKGLELVRSGIQTDTLNTSNKITFESVKQSWINY